MITGGRELNSNNLRGSYDVNQLLTNGNEEIVGDMEVQQIAEVEASAEDEDENLSRINHRAQEADLVQIAPLGAIQDAITESATP